MKLERTLMEFGQSWWSVKSAIGNCQHDSQFGITTWILLFGYLLGLKLDRWLRRKRLWAQGFPMTILSFSNSEYLSTRTCAVVDATVVFTIPPVVSGCFKVTIPPHFSRCKVNRSNPYKVIKKVLFLANFTGDALFNETKITTFFYIRNNYVRKIRLF